MDAATPSRTAMFCSLHRARHSRHDPKPLIDDTWGDQLVPDSIRDLLFEFALSTMDENARLLAMKSRETTLNDRMKASAAYCNAVLRCRYTEDMLEAAAARGVDQYVVIGAGLDSFAVRRPPFARDMQVFEVDHPATQDFKLKRFRELGTAIPSSTHFASSDLSNEDIGSALARTPYRSDRPAFFCWLGVTIYLTREANLDNLKAISWCAGPRSELVFTYFEQSVFGSTSNSEASNECKNSLHLAESRLFLDLIRSHLVKRSSESDGIFWRTSTNRRCWFDMTWMAKTACHRLPSRASRMPESCRLRRGGELIDHGH